MGLSDLLERIRPAGTPGAPASGELRQAAAAAEIGAIAHLLDGFEAEADAIVADARRVAEQIRVDAERRAQQVHADLPDRIAVARPGGASDASDRGDEELATVAAETQRRLAALEGRSAAATDRIAAATLEVIWREVAVARSDGRP